MADDEIPDVVDYFHQPVGERLADAWPGEEPTDEPEVHDELSRRGVHLDPTDWPEIQTTEK